MTTVVMFNGQGAEYPGLGQTGDINSLIFKETLDRAQAELPFALRDYLFAPAPLAARPAALQPALIAYMLATYRAAQCHADVFVGLSLGEYAAAIAAGLLTLEDGLRVTTIRGQAMQEAIMAAPGKMLAVKLAVGQALPPLPPEVWVANRNATTQLVLGGTPAGIAVMQERLRAAGVKAMPLAVAGAFHTPLMAAAQPRLQDALAVCAWHAAKVPMISSTTQAPLTPDTAVANLTAQLSHSTDLARTIQMLADHGATRFIEISPKPMLAKLVHKQLPAVQVQSISDKDL